MSLLLMYAQEQRKKTFKEVMHFHNMTYGHAMTQDTLPRGL